MNGQSPFSRPGPYANLAVPFVAPTYGKVDITTLEGRIIHAWVAQRHPDERTALQRKIDKNRKAQAKGAAAPCPFLKSDHTCRIYAIRPFSCRQLYSVRPCEGRGPTVHRQSRKAAKKAIAQLQRLDTTGYSGHISDILCLLDQIRFRKVYYKGGFDPSLIIDFGKKHGIVINRKASSQPVARNS